jgi:hypothetical protein
MARESPGFVADALWMVAECSLLRGDLEAFGRVAAAFDDPGMAREVESRIVQAKVLKALEHLIGCDWEACRNDFAEAFRCAEERFAADEWPQAHLVHFFYGIVLRSAGRDAEAHTHLQRARDLLAAYGLKARLSILPDHEARLVRVLKEAFRGP